MKKFYLLLIGFSLCLTTAYADNTLSLQNLSIDQGTTEVALPISLTNENSITGFQCDLYLPSGVTVATDEYGDYMIAVARTTASRHTISTSLQADGALRILCTSMTNATFSGNSGTVLNVTLAVPESMAAGTHDMSLKNIVLSDPDANRHTSSDMTATLVVEGGGIEESVNVLSLQDLSIEQGTTEAVLPISLTNESSITGFQCDLYLPSGVTVATDEYGDYMIAVARTTASRHTISTSLQADGALRILCTSMTNATFSGNSGTVLNVTLTVPESMAAGTHDMSLKNIVLSDPDANRHTSPDMTSSLVVAEVEKITIRANNVTMVYGDAMPKFTYTSEGAELVGAPVLSCSATSTSPVGTYPITVAKGSVENKNVSLVNGTLTIVKAPLTISAGSYTKKQGEVNPKFTATYSGFKNGETASVLTKQPTFTTDVTTSTAPGQYAVKVSGAEAQNYEIKYVDGSITVMEIEIVEKINTLTLQDLSIDQGTTESVLPISLTNESSITGFQCDLYLPSGVTVATDEYGDYMIAVARTTASRHTISTSLQVDGALRILCTSMTNATFSGNSGTVLNVTLTVPESMAAGTHDMSLKNIVLSDPDANRHTSPDMTSSLVVAEVEKITIRANNVTMVYGDAMPKFTYTSEGAELVGAPVLSCSATSTSPVGTYPITVAKGSVENKNVSLVNGTLTIVKAPLTISAGSYTKKQGEENPEFVATYSGFKNGESASVLTKKPIFTTDVTTSTAPGQYAVKLSGAEAQNYEISYVDGTITVTENSDYITFQDAEVERICLANWDADGDGLFSKDEAAAVTDLGEAFKGNNLIEYFDELQYFTGLKSIAPNAFINCTELISMQLPNTVTIIGNSAFSCCARLSNINIPESVTMIESSAFGLCSQLKNITFPNSLTFLGSSAFLNCSKIETINIPANVSVIESRCFMGCNNAQSVVVAEENPFYDSRDDCNAIIETATNTLVFGSKNTAVIPNSVTRIGGYAFANATKLSSIEIPESVTRIESNSFASCFGLNTLRVNWKTPLRVSESQKIFKNGDLSAVTLYVPKGAKALYESAEVWKEFGTIVEDPVITADDIVVEYGDNIPTLTFSSDVEVIGTPALSCSATSTSPVGTYPITISKGSVENENVGFVDGTLTIVKAPLTISAGSYTKKQGEENPEFTATYSGFRNGETASVLTKQPTFTTDVTTSTAPGQYAVKVSGAEAQNYEISYVDGMITVTDADKVTITANDITMVYGDAVPDLTYTSEGAELLGAPIVSCEATSSSPVGTYPIMISKGSVKNYNVEYVNGTLTIVKAPLRVVADDCTRAYGEENPVFTVSYEGWVNDEDEEVLTKSATVSCMADEATDVGVYDIVVSGAEATNYSFTYTNGRLTIEKAMQEIVWEQDLASAIIGDQVELTATATSGLEITYQLANNDIAEIYEANGKSYLDCLSVGQVVIKAIQNGDKNYHAAMRVNKTLVVSNPDGIKDVVDENADAPIYNMLGEQMGCSREELQRGVYIQNGRKFVVK